MTQTSYRFLDIRDSNLKKGEEHHCTSAFSFVRILKKLIILMGISCKQDKTCIQLGNELSRKLQSKLGVNSGENHLLRELEHKF